MCPTGHCANHEGSTPICDYRLKNTKAVTHPEDEEWRKDVGQPDTMCHCDVFGEGEFCRWIGPKPITNMDLTNEQVRIQREAEMDVKYYDRFGGIKGKGYDSAGIYHEAGVYCWLSEDDSAHQWINGTGWNKEYTAYDAGKCIRASPDSSLYSECLYPHNHNKNSCESITSTSSKISYDQTLGKGPDGEGYRSCKWNANDGQKKFKKVGKYENGVDMFLPSVETMPVGTRFGCTPRVYDCKDDLGRHWNRNNRHAVCDQRNYGQVEELWWEGNTQTRRIADPDKYCFQLDSEGNKTEHRIDCVDGAPLHLRG
tara:strand:- start:102 stop:1037 length:936 start_codon:yes stop_codon:yes gene_type:complete